MSHRSIDMSIWTAILFTVLGGEPCRAQGTLDDLIRIHDSASGARIELAELLDELASFDAVFVGETHIDEVTHRVEDALFAGLIERRGRVVLSLEMFERDVQETLDSYLAGEIDEVAFRAMARPWKNYDTGYRALVERARRAGLPVVAANAPAAVRRKVSRGGKEALDGLDPEERALLAEKIRPTSQAYWDRFTAVMSEHGGSMMKLTPAALRYGGQSLWDNTMAESAARALAAHPDCQLLHVVGGFHVEYRQGTVEQFLARVPGARVAVVTLKPQLAFDARALAADAPRGDYVVHTLQRGRGLNSGSLGMQIPFELQYRLHLPSVARGGAAVPLLIWLHERGGRAEEAFAFWRAEIGDAAAVAVITAPYPVECGDLTLGGRWIWQQRSDEDTAMLAVAIERIRAYLQEYFPIDEQRVAVGGEGHGATAAMKVARELETLAAMLIAVAPAGWDTARRDATARAARGLCFVDRDGHGDAVRGLLGLEPREFDAERQVVLSLAVDLPLARSWAEIHAAELRAKGIHASVEIARPGAAGEGTVELHPRPALYSEGQGLPLAASPFGGTTVLVLPAGLPGPERAAWLKLEADKVIAKRSRFAKLRVACLESGPSLAVVLGEIRASGGKSVLVVPAVYCAPAATMQALSREAVGFEGDLTISWLPGLGGDFQKVAPQGH